MSAINGERLLSVREVCALLEVHATTIYRFFRLGKLTKVKVGGSTRIYESEVARLMGLGNEPEPISIVRSSDDALAGDLAIRLDEYVQACVKKALVAHGVIH
jgi:excisionase family DNA binding protein